MLSLVFLLPLNLIPTKSNTACVTETGGGFLSSVPLIPACGRSGYPKCGDLLPRQRVIKAIANRSILARTTTDIVVMLHRIDDDDNPAEFATTATSSNRGIAVLKATVIPSPTE